MSYQIMMHNPRLVVVFLYGDMGSGLFGEYVFQ